MKLKKKTFIIKNVEVKELYFNINIHIDRHLVRLWYQEWDCLMDQTDYLVV